MHCQLSQWVGTRPSLKLHAHEKGNVDRDHARVGKNSSNGSPRLGVLGTTTHGPRSKGHKTYKYVLTLIPLFNNYACEF